LQHKLGFSFIANARCLRREEKSRCRRLKTFKLRILLAGNKSRQQGFCV